MALIIRSFISFKGVLLSTDKSPSYKAVVTVPTTFGLSVVSIFAVLKMLDTSIAESTNSA